MIEDIIELYKRKCTHFGQFSIFYNIWIMIIIIIGLGVSIGICLSILLYNVLPEFFLIYTLLLPIIIIEFMYFWSVELYIFHSQKKYIIKIFNQLINDELNEEVKNKVIVKMKKVQRIHFKAKYYFNSNPIGRLYNIIKFEEFLIESNIQNINKLNNTIKEINEYIKDKYNINHYFKIAFLGISGAIVLTPIVEYAQAVYIPKDSTVFVWGNIFLYLSVIAPFILFAVSSEYIYKKIYYSIKIKEKGLLKNMLNKLNNIDFNVKIIDKYLDSDQDFKNI